MYALFSVLFFDAGNSIFSTGKANFEQYLASSAQKAIKLRGARVVCHWLNNPRSSRAPQGYVGVAG
jgi:hypothetical protein